MVSLASKRYLCLVFSFQSQAVNPQEPQKWRPANGEMTKMYADAPGLRPSAAPILLPRILLKRRVSQSPYGIRFIDSGKRFKLDRLWDLYL